MHETAIEENQILVNLNLGRHFVQLVNKKSLLGSVEGAEGDDLGFLVISRKLDDQYQDSECRNTKVSA